MRAGIHVEHNLRSLEFLTLQSFGSSFLMRPGENYTLLRLIHCSF